MRLFMAMGPGDIVRDHRKRFGEQGGRGETSVTFSGQAIELMHARGHRALMVSHNARVDSVADKAVISRNVPRRWEDAGGIRYHLSRMWRAAELALMARRHRAELAIVDSGSAHWFALALFRLVRIPVAVNLHNVRWAQGFGLTGMSSAISWLDSWFFRTGAVAAMGCSPECESQVQADGAERLPYFGWTGQFFASGFEPEALPLDDGPFRIAYVGRIERGKGVFDIIEMATAITQTGGRPVHFELCGDGSDLDAVRETAEAGAPQWVTVRGRLERDDLLEVYRNSHAVIVPTRSSFCEGMPLVCAEAALSGRPVITSRLSNALPVIGPMVVEAEPESIASYVAAIRKLADDPSLWHRLHRASAQCRLQFLDRDRSYAAALDRLIGHIGGFEQPPLDYAAMFKAEPA